MNVVFYVVLILLLICLIVLTVYTSVVTFSNDSKLQRLNKTPSVLVSGAKDVENVKYVMDVEIERMPYLGPSAKLVDGSVLSEGDRVIVCGQSEKTQNGIYVYDGYSLVRADDLKTLESLNTGARVYVESNKTSYAIVREFGTKTVEEYNKDTVVEMWWYANSVTSKVPLVTFELYMVNLLGAPSSSKTQFLVSDSSDKRKMRWLDLPFDIVDGDTVKFKSLMLDTLSVGTLGTGFGFTKTDDTNVTLTMGGGYSSALLRDVSLTLGWTGVLSETRGGTGCSSYTLGDTLYGDSSGGLTKLGGSTDSKMKVLTQTGTGSVSSVPVWSRDLNLTSLSIASNDDFNASIRITNDSYYNGLFFDNAMPLNQPIRFLTSHPGLRLDQINDQYGATNLKLLNRDNTHGIMIEQEGSVDAVDITFKAIYTQQNIRHENRSAYCFNAAPEFQIGNPAQDQPTVFISAGVCSVKSEFRIHSSTSSTLTTKKYVAFDVAAGAGNYKLTYPAATGSANQFLYTNGAGVLAWTGLSASDSKSNLTYSNFVYTFTATPSFTSLTLSTALSETSGGTGQSTYTLGDILYSSASNTLSKLSGNTTTTRKFLRQTGNGSVSAAPAWDTILAADIPSSALTKVDDTNVTLTLGGSPSTALLAATSLTLGWTGTLAETRGGTGNNSYTLGDLLYSSASNTLSKLSGNTTSTRKFLRQTGNGSVSSAPAWDTILAADIPSSALTKVDDTNVTLTLGGSPTTALLAATSLTLGWTGTLAETRGGTGQSTYTLGDLLYSSASNTLSKLSGNTTTTKKFLSQTGNSSVSAAPEWNTIVGTDLTAITISGTCSYLSYSNGTFTSNYNFNQNLTTSSSPSFTSMTLTQNGQCIYLNGSSSSFIMFNQKYGAPTYVSRSVGTKIVLSAEVYTSEVDFAIGMESGAMWLSVNDSSSSFKWYAGTTNIMTLSGAGVLSGATWQGATVGATYGGTGQSTYTLGDLLYSSASNTLSKLSGNTTTTRQFLRQTGNGSVSAAPVWDTILAADIPSSALTKVDDTNVTLTLGGTPASSLLAAVSLTLGWTGTLAETRGGTGQSSYTLGDLLYSSASNTLSKLSGNTTSTRKYLRQTGDGSVSAAPAWDTILAADIPSSALTKVDDTNVTLTLGGSPSTALLAATSLTLGWTGTLAETRGGTGQGTYTLGDMLYSSASNTLSKLSGNTTTTRKFLRQTGNGSVSAAPAWDTILAADIPSSALTKVDDTNVTLTLGGTPASSLLAAVSLTLGWTGTLAETRGGTGQSSYTLGDLLYSSSSNTLSKLSGNTTTTRKFLRQTGNGSVSAAPAWDTILAADIPSSALTKVDDTNVTLTLGGSPTTALLAATSLTLGWTGTLAETRGGTGQGTYTLGDMLYSSASNTLSKLSGNTTTTRKFLRQTGDGSVSAAPAWDTIVGTDLTAISISGSCSYLSYSNGTFTSNYNFNQNLTTSSTPSFSTLTLTGTAPNLTFSNGTSNMIQFGTSGVAAPTLTGVRSVGTKLILYSSFVASSQADYAIGLENNAMWFGLQTTAKSFKWYGGETLAATLTGGGALTLVSTLACATSITLSGTAINTTVWGYLAVADTAISTAGIRGLFSASDSKSNLTYSTGVFSFTATPSFTSLTLSTALSETSGGTGQSTYTLGDLLYSSASNTLSKLSGNTTTTKKFLRQTGDGSVSAAPAWDTIVGTDLTAISISGSCSYLSYSNGTFTSNYNFNQNLTTSSTPTFSTLTLSGTAPNLILSNGTSNMIQFGASGYAAPTITTARSVGTKLILYDSFSNGVSADYAIGIEGGTMWYGVPTVGGHSFKWYGAATLAATLTGAGALTLVSTLACATSITLSGTAINTTVWGYLAGINQNLSTTSSPTFGGTGILVSHSDNTAIDCKTTVVFKTPKFTLTTPSYQYSLYCDSYYDALAFYRETGGILMGYFSAGTVFVLNVTLQLYSGNIEMMHPTSNLINFKTAGIANPSFTSRSAGTKIVLYESLSGSAVDYAIGMGSSTLWYSVETTSGYFKWYGGTTLAATLTGGGLLTLVGGLVLPTSGGTAATMDHYEEYSASLSVTSNGGSGAFSTTPSFAVKINRVGDAVTFTADELSVAASGTHTNYGTSTGTIPSRLRPAYTIQIPIRVRDASAGKLGLVLIQTDGAVVVYFGIDGITSNTNSGNCGHYSFSVSYCI